MAGKASDEAERVAVEQPASDEAVSKVLEHVSNIVENVAKAYGVAPAAAGAIAAATPAAPAPAAEAVVTEESTEKAMTMKDLMKAVGMKDDEDTMKKLKAAGFDPNQKFPTAKPPVAKTTKAAGEVDEDAPFTMAGFTDLIAKAKKFTPGRIDSLKSAVSALKALLDEVDEVPQGTNPGVSPGGSTQFGSSGVKVLTEKSAVDAEILKALTGLTDVVKSLQKDQTALKGEVEAVSKARPASESLEAAGGTETKVSKSALWSGIL